MLKLLLFFVCNIGGDTKPLSPEKDVLQDLHSSHPPQVATGDKTTLKIDKLLDDIWFDIICKILLGFPEACPKHQFFRKIFQSQPLGSTNSIGIS